MFRQLVHTLTWRFPKSAGSHFGCPALEDFIQLECMLGPTLGKKTAFLTSSLAGAVVVSIFSGWPDAGRLFEHAQTLHLKALSP